MMAYHNAVVQTRATQHQGRFAHHNRLLAGLLLGLLCMMLPACVTFENEPTPLPTTTFLTLREEFLNTELGYAFMYPADWTVLSLGLTTTVRSDDDEQGASSANDMRIEIAMLPLDENVDLFLRLDTLIQTLMQQGVTIERQIDLRLDNGEFAARIDITHDGERYAMFLTTIRDRLLEITVYGDVPSAMAILNTLRPI